ncbi:MAG: ribbon-helix-helix domain-containing protein [Elusimicrobia bacterium]|nr:ribbon-helix-helix domain-containing protein [Elusimicrobiota bacterium]
MENTVRWSLIVSKETDVSLRTFLAQHGMRKGDLSKFVEEAVRWRVMDKLTQEVKTQNAHVPPQELESAIDEAVQAIRGERFKPKA